MSGVELIAAERERQVNVEGFTAEHDATHDREELAFAAATYATPSLDRELNRFVRGRAIPVSWPWRRKPWKPSPDDRIRELVKAGALIAAEIDRLAQKVGS